jgi:hypothetical protein
MQVIFPLNENQEKIYRETARFIFDKGEEELVYEIIQACENMQFLGGSRLYTKRQIYRLLTALHFYHSKTQTSEAAQHANQSDNSDV